MLSFGLHLDRPAVLTRNRNPVLVAQDLQLKLNQRPQRRRSMFTFTRSALRT